MRINRLLTIIWQVLMGVLAIVGMFVTQYSEQIGMCLMVTGLISCLLTGFSWTRIVYELGYSEGLTKFIRVINFIIGWIGLIILIFISLFTFFAFSMDQLDNVAMSGDGMLSGLFIACFAMDIGLILNALLRNLPVLFPIIQEKDSDRKFLYFFEDYGYMIFLTAGLIGGFIMMSVAIDFAPYILMLIWNFVVLFIFVFLKCRYEKVWLGYVLVVITAIIDIVAMVTMATTIGENDFAQVLMGTADATIADPTIMFKFTCNAYFLIALLICGPLYFIIEKVFDRLPRTVESIIFFIVPFVAIGLQFLMYYYWYIAVIGAIIAFIGFYLYAFFTAKGGYYDTIYYSDGDYYVVRTYY